MAKIFDVQDWLKNHPNRNNFDLSHKVHGSYKMGKLYPFFCRPVVPSDSFQIDTECSFRFTPMPFPTQSNMRVIFHYFYVRNKNIWKNYENWIEGVEEHEPPYIYQHADFFKRSNLSDYLGIPSDFAIGAHSEQLEFDMWFNDRNCSDADSRATGYPFWSVYGTQGTPVPRDSFAGQLNVPLTSSWYNSQMSATYKYYLFKVCAVNSRDQLPISSRDIRGLSFEYTINSSECLFENSKIVLIGVNPQSQFIRAIYDLGDFDLSSSPFEGSVVNSFIDDDSSEDLVYYIAVYCAMTGETPAISVTRQGPFISVVSSKLLIQVDSRSVSIDEDGVNVPYFSYENQTSNAVKVSALPFRAYESVYNAFYRNSQGVQPFQVDGVTKYNQYISNDGDGADTTDYHLFNRNWELDAYTSCLISPQQGHVPYVGITDLSALGRMSVETPDGHTADVTLSDNGDGVDIRNLHGETPEARAYALRTASLGFTIPEFREANALQRFLEMNIRKGYKYIDFIEGHFGIKPKYNELDMPEFIGGFTQRISVNEISNTNGGTTADELGNTLGAIAGQARAIGRSGRSVRHYCDDFGFIIGIMCIVPDNAYDSILPKHFNLKNPLDMYFPEFSQLSYMPLTHEELAPLVTINDPRGSAYQDLTKVFGYQRPNHDLVWYPDTVHGLFRDASGIGNSVICRRFGQRPELSNDFLIIKPEETDTIFNYTFGDEDVCLGEIALRIAAKRPIPRLVVPQIS